ncbi:MAG: YfhO family protein [Desulfobacterales bacterium]|nr:YfhO family protein [Desulfobacterales bacterium]
MPRTKIIYSILLAFFLVGMQWVPSAVSVCHGMPAVIQIGHSDPVGRNRDGGRGAK